jgi:GWxTD domain-containing protein
MRHAAASFLISLLAVFSLHAADPAADLAEGRRLIESRNYSQAVMTLERARSGTANLPVADRTAALGVIHFYTALAHHHLGNGNQTRAHLEQFLDFSPNARINDREKYPRRFVDTFEQVYEQVNKDVTSFDRYYPGFDAGLVVPGSKELNLNLAMNLLGSRAEKKDWEGELSPTERDRFVADFWQRRDPTPATERNELREAFMRRVEFADHMFPGELERGALSDRGRIFVLLGPPSMVQRRALLKNKDNVHVYFNEQVDGTMELWVYASEQLPVEIPKRAIQYRFVTQKGIGQGVLQRAEEAYATRVLATAGEATIRREGGK